MRKPFARLLGSLLLGILGGVGALKAQESLPADVFPLSQVRPGMKGYGKSVFRGTHIETFEVEVLGVLERWDSAGGHVILVRITSGPPVERGAQVIAGMSGSPIYLQDKVAGAIAYGWGFSKEPIAGVRPIEDMLKALEEAKREEARQFPPSPPSVPVAYRPRSPLRVAGEPISRVLLYERVPPSLEPLPHMGYLLPMGGVLQVGGLSPRTLEWLRPRLEAWGFEVVQGPGASSEVEPVELEPGAALGVQLMTGDIDAAAIGTVTYRQGDYVLAFGHPFAQLSGAELPVSTARVIEILPSLSRSFKFGATMEVVGSLIYDDFRAIVATLARRPRMIPVTVSVHDLARNRHRTLSVQVLGDRDLAPSFILSALAEPVQVEFGQVKEAMVRTLTEVKPAGRPPLRREDWFFGRGFLDFRAIDDLASMLSLVTANIFEPTDVEWVSVEVSMEPGRRTALIERVEVDRDVVQPGDTVQLTVTLRPYRAERVIRTLSLKVPDAAPPGVAQLGVGAGGQALALRASLGAPPLEPDNLEQLLQRFLERYRANELVAYLALPAVGVVAAGRGLEALPPTIAGMLLSPRSTRLPLVREGVQEVMETPWVLQGTQRLTLRIVGREEKPKPPPRFQPPTPPAAPSAQALSPLEGEEWVYAPWLRFVERFEHPQKERFITELAALQPSPSNPPPSAPPSGETKEPSKPTPSEVREAQGRGARSWQHSQMRDFEKGRFEGVALSTEGALGLGATAQKWLTLEMPVLWCMVGDGMGGFYLGGGHDGTLYHCDPRGDVRPFFRTDEVEVLSLARARDGTLYLGTAPGGKVYRVAPDGRGELLCDTPASYIWALAAGRDGSLLAAAGDEQGVLYRIAPDGKAQVLSQVPERHITALAVGRDGVYIGVSPPGRVYRWRPREGLWAVLDTQELGIFALAVGPDGSIYAGTSPEGRVYRIFPDGRSQVWLDTPQAHVLSLWVSPQGIVYAATGDNAALYALRGPNKADLVWDPPAAHILRLWPGEEGFLWALTAGPLTLYRLRLEASSGLYLSEVLNAEGLALWGLIRWEAEVPEGTRLRVQTRTGNTREPGAGWSPWQDALNEFPLLNPPGRFLQYRVLMSSEVPGSTPRLRRLSIAYTLRPQLPVVELVRPLGGECWAQKQKVQWKVSDPDADSIPITLQLSSDDGLTWKTLKEAVRGRGEYEWDTTKVPDGRYRLRLLAGVGSASEEVAVSDTFFVDNTKPQIFLDRPREGRVRVLARDATTPIARAEYRWDEGSWLPAPPEDGVLDDPLEPLLLPPSRLPPGSHRLAVRVADSAGNEAEATFEVTLKATSSQ